MVMEEMAAPRETHVLSAGCMTDLVSGHADAAGGAGVVPGTPLRTCWVLRGGWWSVESWMARVTANRFADVLHGTGIVKTPKISIQGSRRRSDLPMGWRRSSSAPAGTKALQRRL
jgi:hypothetical protein